MLKFKNLKFIILIVSIITFVFLVNTCYAVDLNLSTDLTSNMSGDSNTTDTNTTNTNTTNTTDTNTTNTNGTVIQPTTNRISNTTSGNDLPQTGVTEDITVMFFIIVCVIVAIYAYKKIRDYKS